MTSTLTSTARLWSRFGVATLVVLALTQASWGVGFVATNTTQSDAAPLRLSKGPGTFVQHAEGFRLSSFQSSERINFVEAYTTNADPSDLRIGIYASRLDGYALPPPAFGVVEFPVPDVSKEVIRFAAPIVSSINDGFDTFWTARFASIGATPSDIMLPGGVHWIVYSLANDGILDLDGVAAQSNIPEIYFGDSAVTTEASAGSWTIQGRAVAASIEYGALPEVAVPEIDPSSFGSALSLVVGAIALCEQRRLRGCASAS